jgi:hypothetical protein
MLDIDLSDPINQVRAFIGDMDGSFISDENITFLLTQSNANVLKASLTAMGYILNIVAFYVREEAGDVEVYWGDIYNNLAKRKAALEKDTVYSRTNGMFKFGGTTRSEMKRVNDSVESKCIGIRKEDFSVILKHYGIDPDNPYFLENRR